MYTLSSLAEFLLDDIAQIVVQKFFDEVSAIFF